MTTIHLNRTVLAALIGSALALGLSAPTSAQARQPRDAQPLDAQTQDTRTQDTQTQTQQDDEDARAKQKAARQQEREDRAAANEKQRAQGGSDDAEQQRQRVDQNRQQDEQVRQQGQFRQQEENARQQDEIRKQMSVRQEAERDRQQREQAQQQQQREQGNATRDSQARDADLQRLRERQAELTQQRDERLQGNDRQSRDPRFGEDRDSGQQRKDDRGRQDDSTQDRKDDRGRQNDSTQDDRSGTLVQYEGRPQIRRERTDQRLPEPRRQQLISQQRIQAAEFGRESSERQDRARSYMQAARQQNRHSGSRYYDNYYQRLSVELSRRSWQNHNWDNDPYYYTAPSYRYNRGNSVYYTNSYGAQLLQQALDYGYREGIMAGRADNDDSWRYSYRGSYVYQDASFGYNGYYVSEPEYNYYFREGFRRGYEDGYYGRRRYGHRSNGSDMLLGSVFSLIFNLQPYSQRY